MSRATQGILTKENLRTSPKRSIEAPQTRIVTYQQDMSLPHSPHYDDDHEELAKSHPPGDRHVRMQEDQHQVRASLAHNVSAPNRRQTRVATTSDVTDDESDILSDTGSMAESNVSFAGQSSLNSIVHAKIPFHFQVLILMMIPFTFLIAFASVSLDSASNSRAFVKGHADLVTSVFDCSSAMMVERGLLSLQVGFPVNHSGYNETMTMMGPARAKVNVRCERVLSVVSESSEEDISVQYRNHLVGAITQWEGFRKQAALKYLSTETDVQRWQAIETVNSALAFLSRNKKAVLTAKYFTLLLLARTMANSLGSLRAAGAFYIILNGSAPPELVPHFNNLIGRYDAAKANFVAFGDPHAMEWLASFDSEEDIVRAWGMLDEVRTSKPLYLTVDPLDYFFLFTSALVSMHKLLMVPGGLFEHATAGDEERSQLVSSALQLVFALLCSGAAAAFLVIRQKKNVEEMKKALEQAKIMNGAVRRYVPKRFLSLMGATSILQLNVGDFTEVGVTMLFSDIRNFTDISCTLSNSELFSWLSSYLTRMTTVTEKHHGFVDKFVGDAVFSVFSQPTNGVNCAIEMQILADELSLEVVGKQNKTDIVRIGVGVHHGIVAAGILGDESRHTATLISSDVNLASRLEGLTKYFGARILISAVVAEHLSPNKFRFRRLGKVKAKGQADSVEIYEVFQADPLSVKELKEQTKDTFQKAVRLAEDGDMEGCLTLFQQDQEESQKAGSPLHCGDPLVPTAFGEGPPRSPGQASLSTSASFIMGQGESMATTDPAVNVILSKMDPSGCIVFREK